MQQTQRVSNPQAAAAFSVALHAPTAMAASLGTGAPDSYGKLLVASRGFHKAGATGTRGSSMISGQVWCLWSLIPAGRPFGLSKSQTQCNSGAVWTILAHPSTKRYHKMKGWQELAESGDLEGLHGAAIRNFAFGLHVKRHRTFKMPGPRCFTSQNPEPPTEYVVRCCVACCLLRCVVLCYVAHSIP